MDEGKEQFMKITYGHDAALDSKDMPFEIWAHDKNDVTD